MTKYLFTGDLSYYTWSFARSRILENIGRKVIPVNEEPFYNYFGNRFGNLQLKLGLGP